MFNVLEYDVQFAPNLMCPAGRKLTNTLSFQKGLTSITGANEAGKSFVLEMLRFGLFGAQALRGAADDYVSLSMSMHFTIRGVAHSVERSLKKAIFRRGEEILATGVSPVNEKIVKTLGFGIAVFDVACSANQDELLRITQMKPTERKKLIDSVVGIGALEVVGKWAGAEATVRDRDAKTIRATLVEPMRPIAPEFLACKAGLAGVLAKAEAAAVDLNQIRGWLSHTQEPPVAPKCDVQIPANALKIMAEGRRQVRIKVEELKAQINVLPATVPAMPPLDQVRAQIAAWEAYIYAQERLRANQRPAYPREVAQAALDQWLEHWAYEKAAKAQADLLARIDKLKQHRNVCPACAHSWATEQPKIHELEGQLMILTRVDPPEMNEVQCQYTLRVWENFDQAAYDRDMAVPAAPDPGITLTQVGILEKTLLAVAQRAELVEELATAEPRLNGPDYEKMLAQREAYEAALEVHHAALLAYQEWAKERARKTEMLPALTNLAAEVVPIRGKLEEIRTYERDFAAFEVQQSHYAAKQAEANTLDEHAVQYRLIQTAMAEIRTRVKSFLLPSLNRVASALMSKLTGGARTKIHIDDEFEILVDGQRVSTLSGSGKACANLAIRIALGQVLVAGVMSVFLGDEIDGSMDSFRADETAMTLRNLVNSVYQIMLVSHKNPEADHEIVLGVLNGQAKGN